MARWWGRIAFEVFITVVLLLALIETRDFNVVGTWFPRYTSMVGVALGLLLVATDVRLMLKARRAARAPAPVAARDGDHPAQDGDRPVDGATPTGDAGGGLAAFSARDAAVGLAQSWFAWYLLLIFMIALVGVWVSVVLWLPVTLWLRARSSILFAVLSTVAALGLIYLLRNFLDVRLPPSMFF